MLGNWRETALCDLVSFSNGKSSPRRSNGFPHPVYGSNGVIGYSEETNAEPNTIVVGRVGSYCGSLHYSTRICWVTDNAIRANAIDANDPRFLYYLLQTLRLNNWRAGSGQPLLNQSILSSIHVAVPDPPEQRAIAHILGTLDDKIELNRRMNETLEAMAMALFKSWFVDFDPVRAKMALKRHKSITPPPHTHHSPLEGESEKQGPQPAGDPVGGRQSKGPSPPLSRYWAIKRLYSTLSHQRAKALRQSQTNAEGLLWHYLRKKQLDGHKFRRQQPIGRYIVDFACMTKKLVVELDGGQHSTQKAYDEHRDQILRDRGFRVMRFWNSMVFENYYGVLESILAALQEDPLEGSECAPPHHSPLAGESGRQGPQPAGEPAGGRQRTPPPGGSDWTVERAKAYLDQMPPEIAALFPDRLVDSELGEIPEGWVVKTLGDVVELNPRESMKKGTVAPYLSMAALPTFGSTTAQAVQRKFNSGTRFRNGDTLFARITPCLENGKTAFIQSLSENTLGWGSTEFIVLRAIPPVPPEFTYLLARDSAFREHSIQSMTGTSGRQRVQVKALASYSLPFPKPEIWKIFGYLVNPIFSAIMLICKESRNLAEQRNTLLPKLISGEIRVESGEMRVE